MAPIDPERLKSILEEYSSGFPELRADLDERIRSVREFDGVAEVAFEARGGLRPSVLPEMEALRVPGREIAPERIVALTQGVRPVLAIRDNQATTRFVGPENEAWRQKIEASRAILDSVIPAVGRIELTNSELCWAGTGWLIDDEIIVTNRHVVEVFSRMDSAGRFTFKPGFVSGAISSNIDFMEEEDRADRNEHPIESVFWVSDEDDVAFLRVSRASAGPPLPKPILLSDGIAVGRLIAAIGYPARDPTIPDQELVRRVFGDVYEKKRLAPGKVMSVDEELLRHDCSTLGGNSGSVLVDLETGKAVGLHYGGYLDDSANVAVPARRLSELLDLAKRVGVSSIESPSVDRGVKTAPPASDAQTLNFELRVPIQLSVLMGVPSLVLPVSGQPTAVAPAQSLDKAAELAWEQLRALPGVIDVRAGYRLKRGWITDEPAIVVTVSAKMSSAELTQANMAPLPATFLGLAVDVRTAAVADQLSALGVSIATERPARPGAYVEPPGFDDPNSGMALQRVKDRMQAIFHVSPDSGFPNLKLFLERVKQSLSATIYEWDAEHISQAIEDAILPDGRLLMVTQRRGVGGRDATEEAVNDMSERIGESFSHAYAPVTGQKRLFAGFYHIKVASRDDEEFWLSSGNWKNSGQPDIDPASEDATSVSPLREYNREWHAIVAHSGLATLFRRYIEYDFNEAGRVAADIDTEAVAIPDADLFVSLLPETVAEVPRRIRYFDPLRLDEELDIQPLLTPDRNVRGQRMFIAAATEMIQRATRSVYVQNQSLAYSGDDNPEMIKFLAALRDKQNEGLDVRIIFRDARDFPGPDGPQDQARLLERLQEFGFDVSADCIKLQRKCHTKGIIVDSREVMLGSQNLTNGGALFNRDASLLVRSASVARYFEDIFIHDWENLAHNNAEERVRGIRLASPGEVAPPGFERVRLSALARAG